MIKLTTHDLKIQYEYLLFGHDLFPTREEWYAGYCIPNILQRSPSLSHSGPHRRQKAFFRLRQPSQQASAQSFTGKQQDRAERI